MEINLSSLITEQVNERTKNIDQLSTSEMIKQMNREDQKVALAVQKAVPEIEAAIELIYTRLKMGGRLFYIGAGTSGRLGVLDASECPPTFCTPSEMVQPIIAGGEKAIFHAVEGAEDDQDLGKKELQKCLLNCNDAVVGIAASGRTPFVIGALQYAQETGAATIALSCNKAAEISNFADAKIEAIVGPEVLTGSTRLKAGTAQKMILNMLTTITMIKLGKVYGNLMVELQATNEKLVERSRSIVTKATGVSKEEANRILNQTGQKVKPAIVMIETGSSFEEATQALQASEGFVRQAIARLQKVDPA
jgi:N-acetylmuramic acid 6-phosphate etherase